MANDKAKGEQSNGSSGAQTQQITLQLKVNRASRYSNRSACLKVGVKWRPTGGKSATGRARESIVVFAGVGRNSSPSSRQKHEKIVFGRGIYLNVSAPDNGNYDDRHDDDVHSQINQVAHSVQSERTHATNALENCCTREL